MFFAGKASKDRAVRSGGLGLLLYIEAVGNYVKVYHLRDGLVRTDMLSATSKQLEDALCAYPMIVS